MKLSFICIFSIIFVASATPVEKNEGLQTVGTFRVLINHDVRVKHNQAIAFCHDRGLALISLQTKEKNDVIADFLMKNVDHHVHFWTSGKRLGGNNNNDVFEWCTIHQRFGYTNWEQRSPRPDKNCVSFVEDHRVNSYNWHSEDCNTTNAVICEKNEDPKKQ